MPVIVHRLWHLRAVFSDRYMYSRTHAVQVCFIVILQPASLLADRGLIYSTSGRDATTRQFRENCSHTFVYTLCLQKCGVEFMQ